MYHRLSSKKLVFLTTVTAIGQQACVAYSTYALGIVGSALFNLQNFQYLKVCYVFLSIGFAYVLGAISYRLSTVLGAVAWESYCRSVLRKIQGASDLDTPKNKAAAFAWLGGEALSFFESAAFILQDGTASFCNFLFHLVVLHLLLGSFFSTVMATSLLLSGVLMLLGQRQLEKLNQSAQTQRAQVLMTQMHQWDANLLGNPTTQTEPYERHHRQFSDYQKQLNKKVLCENFYEVFPIESALLIFMLCLRFKDYLDPSRLGVLVTTLPRIIQLLQQNSVINGLTTKLIGLRAKFKQLRHFVGQLERLPLEHQIHTNQLSIHRRNCSVSQTLDLVTLWNHLATIPLSPGRYRIRGRNGAGKTSLLKLIKKRYPKALYMGATGFGEVSHGSTGQKQASELLALRDIQGSLVLLDEWDAHLDASTRQQLDAFLSKLSASNCLVEVSHHLE